MEEELGNGSDSDKEDKKNRKIDFFLDRQIDGVEHIRIAKMQASKRPKDIVEWSGEDVLPKIDPYKTKLGVEMLNVIRVWPYRAHGYIKKGRVFLRQIMNGSIVENGMTLCVLGNTVVLSLDYYGASVAV